MCEWEDREVDNLEIPKETANPREDAYYNLKGFLALNQPGYRYETETDMVVLPDGTRMPYEDWILTID